MKKVKVTFKGDVVKTFNLEKIDIIPNRGGVGPSMLNLSRRGGDRYILTVTPDIIPDVSFLDKIEIIEE